MATRKQQKQTAIPNSPSPGDRTPEGADLGSFFDDEADIWPTTRARIDSSRERAKDVLEQVRAAYDPDLDTYLHAFHHAHVGAFAALQQARTPEALKRAASKLGRWQRYLAWLNEAKRIATQHEMHDAASHHELAKRLADIRDRFESSRAMSLEGSSWSAPHGMAPWKTSQRKLAAILKNIESIERLMGEVAGDPVAMGAIKHVDSWRAFSNLLSPLHDLKLIIQAASQLQASAGNRRLPKWTVEAADVCRNYWRTFGTGEPTPCFRRDETGTNPANKFSTWFCDLMFALAGYHPPQSETILRKKHAALGSSQACPSR